MSHVDNQRRDVLAATNPEGPAICDAMQQEGVNRWVDGDESGYATLIEAVRAGPIVVG